MSATRTLKILALMFAIGLTLLVSALAFRLWDNGRVRVQSAEQAIEMAKTAAGPRVGKLPLRVEADQDSWTVRFGPDERGQVHSYMVTIWDKRAGPVTEQTVVVDLKLD